MGSRSTQEVPLRTAVAANIKVSVRTVGKRAGVSIKAKKTYGIRNFKNAPKRLNAKQGWDHPFFGDWSKKVHQVGKPGWFDETLKPFRKPGQKAAKEAMDRVAKRISQRTRG